jgi:hypothetical protein
VSDLGRKGSQSVGHDTRVGGGKTLVISRSARTGRDSFCLMPFAFCLQ